MSDLPELRHLVNDLESVKTKWYGVGLQLGVDEETLEGIKSAKDEPEVALRRMLQEWRKITRPEPSLVALLEALCSPSIKENRVAKRLEKEYVASKQGVTMSEDGAEFDDEAPEKVSYPDVQRNINNLYKSFEKLRSDVYVYLHNLKPDIKEFETLVSFPQPALKIKPRKSQSAITLEQLCKEVRLIDLLRTVNCYSTWFNFEQLDGIVEKYGNSDLKGRMEKYRSELTEFETGTCLEKLNGVELAELQEDSVSIIVRLPHHHCSSFKASYVRKLKKNYTDKARLGPAALRIYKISGSTVKIIFLVPIALAPHLLVASFKPMSVLTSQKSLPSSVYERCVHMIHEDEASSLMMCTAISSNDTSLQSFTSVANKPPEVNEDILELDTSYIKLNHDQVFVEGDNTVVCKALFRTLPSAAKYIHPELIKSSPLKCEEFKNGCRILKKCHHPNIITCLGMFYDTKYIKGPVLLMELMDQSLKEFIEQEKTNIPISLQLDICSDVAQGLEYLHANDIIHGNLTAANVLFREGTAKICGAMTLTQNLLSQEQSSDHAGAKVLQQYFHSSVYDGVYDGAVDCFAFGVLAIHIITRELPQPDPQVDGSGVYEISLRKVDRKHPLYSLIIDCLNDVETGRPPAMKLCKDISCMRESQIGLSANSTSSKTGWEAYTQRKIYEELQTHVSELNKQLKGQEDELYKQLCNKKKIMDQKQEETEELQKRIAKMIIENQDLEKKIMAGRKSLRDAKKRAFNGPKLLLASGNIPEQTIKELQDIFKTLRERLYDHIEKTPPVLKEFAIFVSCPMPPSRKECSQFTCVDLDCIMQPGTQFSQMFSVIDKYTNWYNYELLESIIKKYGSPELKKDMSDYSLKLTEFENTTSNISPACLFTCLPN